MTHRFSRAPVAALAGCAALGLALAACSNTMPSLTGGPSESDRVFLMAAGNWDRNKDGVVTCDEWKAYAEELFGIGDVERKGYLTPQDWTRITAIDKMFETVDFKYYDRNGDGKVDRAEFVERKNRAFELADRDSNCQLTSVELTAARTAGTLPPKIVPTGSESGTDKRGGPPGR
jgi:EF hand